ncbi:class GN sortase [Agarivorans sp. QJM3NY_29]|uniref:class GN sortase n=1 Tax=unclassified Agarivorans TaxID=2636026 RepID=UPI003D7D4591
MILSFLAKHPLPCSLFLFGVLVLSHGLYIQAKAYLAQLLIAQAWQHTLVDQQPHKPWQWADTYPVGKLSFVTKQESINFKHQVDSVYVLAGASGRTLAFAPGLVLSGAKIGEVGNTVIAGHRDTHFANLAAVNKGDLLQIEASHGETLLYQVMNTQIVDQSATQFMAPSDDNRLTLITCYPFNQLSGGAQQRYIVEALLVHKPRVI